MSKNRTYAVGDQVTIRGTDHQGKDHYSIATVTKVTPDKITIEGRFKEVFDGPHDFELVVKNPS